MSNYSFKNQKTGSTQHCHLFTESIDLCAYFHINHFCIKGEITSSSGAAHNIIWLIIQYFSIHPCWKHQCMLFCMLVCCPPSFLTSLTSLFTGKSCWLSSSNHSRLAKKLMLTFSTESLWLKLQRQIIFSHIPLPWHAFIKIPHCAFPCNHDTEVSLIYSAL